MSVRVTSSASPPTDELQAGAVAARPVAHGRIGNNRFIPRRCDDRPDLEHPAFQHTISREDNDMACSRYFAHYPVRDTLFELAQQVLGDGNRWHDSRIRMVPRSPKTRPATCKWARRSASPQAVSRSPPRCPCRATALVSGSWRS